MMEEPMIDAEGENMPAKLADLYMNTWTPPKRTVELWEMELEYQGQNEEEETNSEQEPEVVMMEEQSVAMNEQGVILVEPVQDEEANALSADELVEEIELDNHQEPTQFRLE